MAVIIKKKTTKKEIEILLLKINHSKNKKSLRNVHGVFPIEGDAVEIQKKMRNEWD